MPRESLVTEAARAITSRLGETEINDFVGITPTLLFAPTAPGDYQQDILETEDQFEFRRDVLGWPNRPHLSSQGNSTALVWFVDRYHEQYRRLFDEVSAGGSPTALFGARGFPRTMVTSWIKLGSEEIKEGLDTYHTRFSLDICRAMGSATSQAQLSLYAKRPDVYLARNTAFGDEYSDGGAQTTETSRLVSSIPAVEEAKLLETADAGAIDQKHKAVESAQSLLAAASTTPEELLRQTELGN